METMYADTFVGAKAGQISDAAEISKAVKKELTAMRKAGELPAEITFSVKSRKYSMGQAVDVTVSGWTYEQVYTREFYPEYGREFNKVKPEAEAIIEKIEAVRNQYNREAINSMIDYFDVNYYGRTEWDWRIERTATN
jgi:hypothetical protein